MADVRLCLTNDFRIGKPLHYATLSHCWGKSNYLTLKKSNIKQFIRKIPPEALSKTFKEAIYITKELGISYIWIDSLCIIQDDPHDWEEEASKMAGVYGGSKLNIAATGAADGAIGCFFERHSSCGCLVETQSESGTTIFACVPPGIYTSQIARLPLCTRGWALQERLLPSRTIHFTPTQVFWECYESVASELCPTGVIQELTYGQEDYFFQKAPVNLKLWKWIIKQYSRCNLTFAIDRFLAIAGISEAIQHQTNDQYVAGLWREKIEEQLCWKVNPKTKIFNPSQSGKEETKKQYIAPTWS